MKLMPESSAAWMIRTDSSWSVLPHSPNIIAPRQRGLTLTPVVPSARYSIALTLVEEVARLADRDRQRRRVEDAPDAHVRERLQVPLSGRDPVDPLGHRALGVGAGFGVAQHRGRQLAVDAVEVVAHRCARQGAPAIVAVQGADAVT